MSQATLRPIPTGNAVSVEASASDPLSATRLALVQLADITPMRSVTSLTVSATLVDADNFAPWEAVAYAALAE